MVRRTQNNGMNRNYISVMAIHWPQIDEDLSFEGMFSHSGLCERTLTEDAVCYRVLALIWKSGHNHTIISWKSGDFYIVIS